MIALVALLAFAAFWTVLVFCGEIRNDSDGRYYTFAIGRFGFVLLWRKQ